MKRSLAILLAALVALILVASFAGNGALWGLSAWGAISPFAALVGAIIVVPQLFLRTAPDPFRRLPRIPSSAGRLLATVALSAAFLWLLRARHELWGERFSLVAALDRGTLRPGAPLATLVQWAAYRFVNEIFLINANSVVTFFSVAAGAAYALLAIRAAGLLFEDDGVPGARRLASAVLLSGGFVALFFGFGGCVQIALVAVIAFMTESIRFLRGTGSLMAPAVLLAAAILSHLSAAFLVPAFVYLLARGLGTPEFRRRSIAAGSVFVLCLAAAEIVAVATARRLGFEQTFMPDLRLLFEHPSVSGALNALLILGPASAAAVLLLLEKARRRAPNGAGNAARGERTFLAACALSALAAFIVGSGLADGGLRWHLFAATGPAFSLYVLWELKRDSAGAEGFRRVATSLFLVGAFQTLPLVIVDAVPHEAERRLASLALAPGRAEMIIADFALQGGDLEKAQTQYVASLAKNAKNELADLRLGRIAMKGEAYPEAITHFLDAHELNPAVAHDRFELAEALIANRWFPEAIAELETLVTAHPESVVFWRRLGFARNNGGRYESAVAAYEKALSLEPANEDNVRNLVSALLNRAAELQKARRDDEATALYGRVISMYPRDWRAYNNLAVIEMNHGRLNDAYETLDGALKTHPYETSLHFNMGIVLEKLGKPKEALAHMLTARDLDPVYSEAPPHIVRLERKLGIYNPGKTDSLGNPYRNP
ncbi:MAG TPA: tetratricopeptide repeat protein [Candidatus Bathyarchaeia archaeon]|nr:tetratricopeptide repeat protein [Candidatus Bathyarchaeia archaeon]